jgi:hypothetical protein
MTRKGHTRETIPAQDPPSFSEVSTRLKSIIDRSQAIDEQVAILEAIRERDRLTQKARHGLEVYSTDRYRQFCRESAVCVPAPPPRPPKLSDTDSCVLSEVMDVINELRREVSNLATRQNEMKGELDRIRGRLC